MQRATFGAGCFWGVEVAFRRVGGVVDVCVGYTGGSMKNPTYEDVCTDTTGHAEVVLIEYDPKLVSYEKLLEVFFDIHDPTTPNRQGPDIGSQYRSVIFFHTSEQEKVAKDFITRMEASGRFRKKVVTQVVPAAPFYRAEEYHQRYHEKHGGSCKS